MLHYLHGHNVKGFQAAAPTYADAFRAAAAELDAKDMNEKVLNITVEYLPPSVSEDNHLVTVYFDYSM